MSIYKALDGALQFPAMIPERLGLALAAALEADAALGPALMQMLGQARPKTPAEEQALLTRALRPARPDGQVPPKGSEDIAPGFWLQVSGTGATARYTLSGPGLRRDFKARLAEWLKSPI